MRIFQKQHLFGPEAQCKRRSDVIIMAPKNKLLFVLAIMSSMAIIATKDLKCEASVEEKKAIKKQSDEIKRQRQKVKELIDRIAAEIEREKFNCRAEKDDSRIPLTWPKGTYGLPMPKSGCPKGTAFQWQNGTRYQDTEDDSANNQWSPSWDLAGRADKNNMEQRFCIKTNSDGFLPWPKGQYCIFKKGPCPKGFNQGWINWDDEDDNNGNSRSGTLPDGQYSEDTKIEYCCRKDGFATNEIILPTDSPFVMFKAGYQCQHVKGMNVTEEYFRFDTEDDGTKNQSGGSIPFGEVNNDVILYYCYYHQY